uniref:Phospholipase C/D domain-containing protein n=1 Tax=Solibacter usitatus (strain Ellin6076) TaxID=234267 RepID=Q025L8_SOLUE
MRDTSVYRTLRYPEAVYWAVRCTALLLLTSALHAYSVLTHEAIIDTAWDGGIKPLLLKRYPQATKDDLLEAHAHAYGGCIIQDMGYYPFGSKFFSDLVHYVRTGEFVENLVKEAQTLDELAFALGALAHFAADTQGHSIAVNQSVPIEYPKLRRKFGQTVTYADDKTSHLRVEFGFDVLQVARGSYAPQAYHDFIGFEVSKEVLERAFHDTYSLELHDVFGDLDLALGTYRKAVSGVIPELTRVAWNLKKDELVKATPSMTRRKFVYNISKASYRKEWHGKYKGPGLGARILAFFIRILPKIGPLKALSFKPPTKQTATLFELSFNRALDEYRGLLTETSAGRLKLDDRDFDTGKPTRPGEYRLADNAYATLVQKLAEKPPAEIDAALLANVLEFYRDPQAPNAVKKDPKEWRKVMSAVDKLRAIGGPAKASD